MTDKYAPTIGISAVNILWSIRAHKDSIASLQRISSPPSLLSSSHEHTVRLWGTEGDDTGVLYGSLLQGIRGDDRHPLWRFPVDVAQLHAREQSETSVLMQRMERNLEQMKKNRGGRADDEGSHRRNPSRREAHVGEDHRNDDHEDDDGHDERRGAEEAEDGSASPGGESSAGQKSQARMRLRELQSMKSEAAAGASSALMDRRKKNIQAVADEEAFDREGYKEFEREWFATRARRDPRETDAGSGEEWRRKRREATEFRVSGGVRNPRRILGRNAIDAGRKLDMPCMEHGMEKLALR